MSKKRINGIYFIKNKVAEKFYIGCSQDVRQRINSHKSSFQRGKNIKGIQKDWDEYGSCAFEFGLLEDVQKENILETREQFYIDKIKETHNLYNIRPALKKERSGNDAILNFAIPIELKKEFQETAKKNSNSIPLLIRKWIENYIGENYKEEIKMEKLNTTKINGDIYQLPEGYYAVNGRFGDQVYNDHGENVTQKIQGDHNQGGHNSDDYIITTDKGIVKLKPVK